MTKFTLPSTYMTQHTYHCNREILRRVKKWCHRYSVKQMAWKKSTMAYALEKSMSNIRFSTPLMLKDLLFSTPQLNDTTISPTQNSETQVSYLILSIFHSPQKINHHNISCIFLVTCMPTDFSVQSIIFAHIYYFNSILLVIRSTLQACARISFLKHNFDHFISLLRNHSTLFYNP